VKGAGAQTFLPIFGHFAIFDRNFAKFVAPPSAKTRTLCTAERPIAYEKNSENRNEIDP